MKSRSIGLVTDGGKRLALQPIGVGKHVESLIAVSGDHDVVERLHSVRADQLDSARGI